MTSGCGRLYLVFDLIKMAVRAAVQYVLAASLLLSITVGPDKSQAVPQWSNWQASGSQTEMGHGV